MAKAAVPPERKARKKAGKPSKKAKASQAKASPSNRGDYGLLAKIAWLLLILACGLAMVPSLGFIAWLLATPVLIATLVLSIVVMYRGGTVQGGILLALSVIGAPLFIYLAPAISSTAGVEALVTAFGKSGESATATKSKQPALSTNTEARLHSAPSTGPKRQIAKPQEKRNENSRGKFDPLAERNAD